MKGAYKSLCVCDVLSIRNILLPATRFRAPFRLPDRHFHTSTPFNALKRRTKASYKQNALESAPASSKLKAQRSRMQLSRDVEKLKSGGRGGRGGITTDEKELKAKRKGGEIPVIERGCGMNRRIFTAPLRRSSRSKNSDSGKDGSSATGASSAQRTGRGRRGNVVARASQPSSTSSQYIRPPDRVLKHMSVKAALQPRTAQDRVSATTAIEKHQTFESMRLLPEVIEAVKQDALRDMTFIEPSPVQRLVVPELMKDQAFQVPAALPGQAPALGKTKKASSYLIAAETGSGKTLAYLLPIIDVLKRRERAELELLEQSKVEAATQRRKTPVNKYELFPDEPVNLRNPKAGKPLAVVLVPTSELATQVGNLATALSHIPKFRARMISREVTGSVIRARLFRGPVDILISTPHLLNTITDADPNILSLTSHIVVDEADSLFDRSFTPITKEIIGKAKSLEALILCSATVPKSLDTYLERFYPDMKRLATPNLHAIPRHVQLSIVDVERLPYSGNKFLACADVLDQISKDNTEFGFTKRVVVFVNERGDTTKLAEYLHTKGFDAVDVNRDTESRAMIESFTGPKDEEKAGLTGRKRLKVLVTTDITSRGIDTKAVKNVILFDVPFSTIDFIHRVGRTGRMGRRGRAFVLVDKDSNMAWVKDIKKAMFLGKSLV